MTNVLTICLDKKIVLHKIHYFLFLKFSVLTLFIMSELIVNSKLAKVGHGHFKLHKYPPKRKFYEKIAVLTGIRTWDQ